MIQFRALGKCVQSSLNIATLPWNKEYHMEEINKIFPEEYCSIKIGQVADVLALNLTFQETILLKSIVITFPGQYGSMLKCFVKLSEHLFFRGV